MAVATGTHSVAQRVEVVAALSDARPGRASVGRAVHAGELAAAGLHAVHVVLVLGAHGVANAATRATRKRRGRLNRLRNLGKRGAVHRLHRAACLVDVQRTRLRNREVGDAAAEQLSPSYASVGRLHQAVVGGGVDGSCVGWVGFDVGDGRPRGAARIVHRKRAGKLHKVDSVGRLVHAAARKTRRGVVARTAITHPNFTRAVVNVAVGRLANTCDCLVGTWVTDHRPTCTAIRGPIQTTSHRTGINDVGIASAHQKRTGASAVVVGSARFPVQRIGLLGRLKQLRPRGLNRGRVDFARYLVDAQHVHVVVVTGKRSLGSLFAELVLTFRFRVER